MKKEGISKTVLVGAGLAALTGYYFLADSKEAKARRKQMRGWMLRFKGDVMDRLEDMKDMSADAYEKAVDAISEKYENMKGVDGEQLKDLRDELKGHWEAIREEMGGAGAAVKKAGKAILKNGSKK